MGKWNRINMGHVPCMDCPEREIGCHGRCGRYRKWREEKDEKNRRAAEARSDTISTAAIREIWRKSRWSRQQPISRSGKER